MEAVGDANEGWPQSSPASAIVAREVFGIISWIAADALVLLSHKIQYQEMF